MRNSYITYYEGLDVHGEMVMSGNSAFDIVYDEPLNAGDALKDHSAYLDAEAKTNYQNVSRIVIKGLFKL